MNDDAKESDGDVKENGFVDVWMNRNQDLNDVKENDDAKENDDVIENDDTKVNDDHGNSGDMWVWV